MTRKTKKMYFFSKFLFATGILYTEAKLLFAYISKNMTDNPSAKN